MPRYILKSREKQKREESMADRRLSFRADCTVKHLQERLQKQRNQQQRENCLYIEKMVNFI